MIESHDHQTSRKVFWIGTVRYNWPMSAHASQAFSIAHCTDLEDLPTSPPFATKYTSTRNYRFTINDFLQLFHSTTCHPSHFSIPSVATVNDINLQLFCQINNYIHFNTSPFPRQITFLSQRKVATSGGEQSLLPVIVSQVKTQIEFQVWTCYPTFGMLIWWSDHGQNHIVSGHWIHRTEKY